MTFGDATGFVMKVEGLSFPEAVEKLAAEAGISTRLGHAAPSAFSDLD